MDKHWWECMPEHQVPDLIDPKGNRERKNAVYTTEIPGAAGCRRNCADGFHLSELYDPPRGEYGKNG